MNYNSSAVKVLVPEDISHLRKSKVKLPLPQGYVLDTITQGYVPEQKDIITLNSKYCGQCGEMPECETRTRILEKLIRGKYFEFRGNIQRLIKEDNGIEGPLVDIHCAGYWTGQFELDLD